MYQAKLGYNRGEVAIVPTNRSANEEPGSQGGGAKDSTDVLMELKYNGIFSQNGGIYQRLAVGKTAVKQPGAAFMFAKNNAGEIEPETAAAISTAVQSIRETSEEVTSMVHPLGKSYTLLHGTHAEVFNNAAKSVEYKDFRSFMLGKPGIPTQEQVAKVRSELEKNPEIKLSLDAMKSVQK
jgi:hypothetical protein